MIPLLLAALAGQGLGGLALKYGAQYVSNMRTQEADEKEKKQKTILDDIYGDVDMSTPEGQAVAQQRMLQQPMTFGAGLDMQNAQLQRQHAIELENLRNTNQLGQMGYGADLQADRDVNQFGREWAKMKYEAGQNMSLAQMRLKAEREAVQAEIDAKRNAPPKLADLPQGMDWEQTENGPRAVAIPNTPIWNSALKNVDTTERVIDSINTISSLAQETENWRSGPVKTRMEGLREEIVQALAARRESGQLGTEEYQRFKDQVPSAKEITFIESDKQFQEAFGGLYDIFDRDMDLYRKQYEGWRIPIKQRLPKGFTEER